MPTTITTRRPTMIGTMIGTGEGMTGSLTACRNRRAHRH
jgi:hypothetical protein